MNEREKLIEELQPLVGGQREYAERGADFILADRKRIVEPLVKVKDMLNNPEWGTWSYMEGCNVYNDLDFMKSLVNKTLKNAGEL